MTRWLGLGAAACVVASLIAFPAGATPPAVVCDNVPSPQPGNVPSVGFEATSTSEFGGLVQLAGATRVNPTVTVLMSSWGCESGSWTGTCTTTPGATFSHPITLNLYNVGAGGAVGSLIATKTQTFEIPYRPSSSPSCGDGRWSDGTTCFNGYGVPISFDLPGVTLPDQLIVGVAYNTTHYGDAPIGEGAACYTSSGGCGYDSLNVGTAPAPTTGTTNLDDAYLSSTWGGAYCDNGAGGTGTFRLDAGCWTGYLPAVRITVQKADQA